MSAAADLWQRYDLAVPVDLRRLVDNLGLEVVAFPFRGRIREMIVDGVIGVQPGLPRPWFRWYVAHAIGHHLMHLGTSFYLDGWQWVSHAKTEHQAEEFAAWLLTGADGGHCSAAELGIPAEKAHLVGRCPSRALKNSFDYRSGALSSEEREEIVCEGRPQTPGKGA